MRTQGSGTTGFFIALSLFFLADDRFRYGRSGRFGCLFRFFAFAAFVLFGFGRFLGFCWFSASTDFSDGLLSALASTFASALASTASTGFGFFFLGFGRFAFRFWCSFGSFQFGCFGLCFGASFGFAAASASALASLRQLEQLLFLLRLFGFRCYFGFSFRCQFFGRRNGNGTAAAACFHFYAVNGADSVFFAADADGTAVAAVFSFCR